MATENQRPSVPPRTLTVLVSIRRGEEEALRDLLRPIGDDIAGKRPGARDGRPRIEFQRSRRIHFARFALCADPDRGRDRQRLLYSATYDGDLDDHLAELMAITSDPAAIWGRCEGYTGPHEFASFIRAHMREPDAFYIAFREETADSIRNAGALRRHLQTLTATAPARALHGAVRSLYGGVRRLMRALPLVVDVVRAMRRCGVVNVVRAGLQIVASLNRYRLFRVLNRLTGNRMPLRQSPYSSVPLDNCAAPVARAPSDGADQPPPTFREDVVAQNQLTLVTVLKPGHVDRVRAVMAAIDAYSKRLAPPGSLIGISTIHFVKWLIIDDDRRLLMISDYDGSWESYIDEFAEMILSGLDAIWDSAEGYPPDGARDVPAFKWFLRSHQIASEVFFSAYPDHTVLNIVNDLGLTHERGNLPIDPRHGPAQQLYR